MTAKGQATLEAYRRRIRQLRSERIRLANCQGEQLALDLGVDERPPVTDAEVLGQVTNLDTARTRRRRGWVPS